METLADDDEERFKQQFAKYIENDIEADGLEELYAEAHKAIREDPLKKDEDDGEKKDKAYWKEEGKNKMTKEEKDQRIKDKIAELAS